MDSYFLACLGGSGSKVMEAVVHMAALGMWKGAALHVLLVDVDGGNGNHEQAKTVAELYQSIHDLGVDNDLFASSLTLYEWTPTIEDNSLVLLGHGNGQEESGLLSKHLFTGQERRMTISEGFKGHPNIGVLFMQQILSIRGQNQADSLARFIQAAAQQKADRMLVVGSCYGGTGASCIPVLGHYLRKALGDGIALGLLAVLPSFSLTKDSDDPIDPDSSEFPGRVKTVLSTYIGQRILTYQPQAAAQPQRRNLYEKIYLLGSPKPIPFTQYAPGNNLQLNPATFFDWFACAAVADYVFAQDPLQEGVYTACLEPGPWDWRQFSSSVFPGLHMHAAKLLIAAGLYMSELHVSAEELVKPAAKRTVRPNMLELYFSRVPSEQYETLQGVLDRFAKYTAYLVLWFYQIVINLPKEFFSEMEAAGFQQGKSSAALERIAEDSSPKLTAEEIQQLQLLYYQSFFSPPALLRMEKIRRQCWPRGSEQSITAEMGDRYLKAYASIFSDNLGDNEEKRLGVLLPDIALGQYYSHATADKLLGLLYNDGVQARQATKAASILLRRLFFTIDTMVTRGKYA